MKDRGKAMVMASFIGDSLALGVHWIYDTKLIRETFGRVEGLLRPKPDSYHPTKDKGEFTHYGDQGFVLLESLASEGVFDPEDYGRRWRDFFKGYGGYFDHATKDTLANLDRGKSFQEAGSSSEDLAGASRIAPLVYGQRSDLDGLVKGARTQTRMTHDNHQVVDCAEFFARVSWKVLQGEPPISAMEEVARRHFKDSPMEAWTRDGIESKERDSVSAISDFGQSCHYGHAFPGVIHLIAKYEDDLKEALIQTVMAGGDSAARGMAVGMILGAYLGWEGIPAEWISGLRRGKDILALLDRMP